MTVAYIKQVNQATKKHLKKTDEITVYHSVVKHLENKGLTTRNIGGYKQLIDAIEKHVAEHTATVQATPGLTSKGNTKTRKQRSKKVFEPGIQEKAMEVMKYLKSNFHLHKV